MNPSNTSDALNRLYGLHHRSLPAYLRYAKPYALKVDDAAKETLDRIGKDHEAMAARIGDMIFENNENPDPGEFPMEFTFYNDLSADFLVRKTLEHQVRVVREIEGCVEQLNLAPMAKALAEECLGAAKGHHDSLQELTEKAA